MKRFIEGEDRSQSTSFPLKRVMTSHAILEEQCLTRT
jgi:hypothetical protein